MQEQTADISLLSAEYYYLRKTFYKNKNNLYVLFALLMNENECTWVEIYITIQIMHNIELKLWNFLYKRNWNYKKLL